MCLNEDEFFITETSFSGNVFSPRNGEVVEKVIEMEEEEEESGVK